MHDFRDIGFEQIFEQAKSLSEANDISIKLAVKRVRRKKRQPGEQAPDEPINDPKTKLRIELFNYVTDVALTAIKNRFISLQIVQKKYGPIFNLTQSASLSNIELSNLCANLCGNNADPIELASEIRLASKLLPPFAQVSPLEALNFLATNDMFEIFPNFQIVAQIFLTLPVSVANAERSFSKLKLIKNRLRSTMTEDRLNSLALLSIEHELAQKIDFDNTISQFASLKARRCIV